MMSSTPAQANTADRTQPVSDIVCTMLKRLGVKHAFGVSGGGIADTWAAMERDPDIDVLQCRHEGGAAFAATEASLATGRPTVVFTTAGPGITNSLTGMFAARSEGAKVILLSPASPSAHRGKAPCQETSDYTFPISGIFTSGPLFHFATIIHNAVEIPEAFRRLSMGCQRRDGFVAHLSIPLTVQRTSIDGSFIRASLFAHPPTIDTSGLDEVARKLSDPFAIWLGFGARNAAESILRLAEQTGAPVMCSPRSKGVFPEDHPQFLGVTGFGGHRSVFEYMRQHRPKRILVLGSRLVEFTSFWSSIMEPEEEFIQVDLDPTAIGAAYPHISTHGVVADVDTFVRGILGRLPANIPTRRHPLPRVELPSAPRRSNQLIHPAVLLEAMQRQIVDGTDAIVMAEPGNAMSWGINRLRFRRPGRFRTSVNFASMGHTSAGIVGAAFARGKAVTLVGDCSLLMNNEINTAVKCNAPAVWIVLNDASYNMVDQVMPNMGLKDLVQIPMANFAMIAEGMGAQGIRIDRDDQIDEALKMAMAAKEPFVVDAVIDPSILAPTETRLDSLKAQQGSL